MAVFDEGRAMVQDIIRWGESGRIIIPDFQRRSVWNREKKSMLILSILKYFIPPIILYKDTKEQLIVIDGLQRLTTIISFYNDEFKLKFDLSKIDDKELEFVKSIQGKAFSELDESIKNKILNHMLSYIIIKDADYSVAQNVFKFINSNPTPLNPMELRYALYYGTLLKGLREFAELEKDFLKSFFKKTFPHKRMKDVELILRIYAFAKAWNNPTVYQKNINKFLDFIAYTYRDENPTEVLDMLMDVIDTLMTENYDMVKFSNNLAWLDVIGMGIGYSLDNDVDVDFIKLVKELEQNTQFMTNITERSNTKPHITKARMQIIKSKLEELFPVENVAETNMEVEQEQST